jgi:hypothetical protein
MSYVDELKIVWMMPMRTATRSSTALIRDYDTFTSRGHDLTLPIGKEHYTLIFNIRNPLPRIVSIYWLWGLHHGNYKKNFKDWLFSYKKWQNLYQLHLDKYISVLPKPPDYFVRTEYFDDDLKRITELKEHFISLGRTYDDNVLNNAYVTEFNGKTDKIRFPWYSEYDELSAEFVHEICRKQFDLFNYNPNYWKDGTP